MTKTTAVIHSFVLILLLGFNTSNAENKTGTAAKLLPVFPDSSTEAPLTTPSTITSTTTSTTSSTTTSTTTTTTTTTEPPETTTLAPITTNAPSTTAAPEPTTGSWFINGTDGNLIIVKMAVQLEIMYPGKNNQTLSHVIDLPADNKTQVTGEFNQFNESMKLSWKSSADKENSLTLNFYENNKTSTYELSSLEIEIQPEDLPNINSSTSLKLIHNKAHYTTSLGNSYRCVKKQTFNLTKENEAPIVGYMMVTDLQFQAFKKDNKKSFGFAEDCALETPDAVPIAVGCVLAGLVVIVLAAYLVNRRRSQVRGYHSM